MTSVTKHNNLHKFVASTKKGAKRTRAQAKQQQVRKNPVLWILSAGFAGALIASSIFMQFNFLKKPSTTNQSTPTAIQESSNTAAAKAPEAAVAPVTPEAPSQNDTPTFDFYTVLPKMESGKAANATATKPALDKTPNQPPAPTKNIAKKYMVQIKTLESIDAADELKAELILGGFSTYIEPIQKNNTTWYRVVVGPFKTESTAKNKQDELIKQNIYGSFIKQEQ